MIIREPIKVLTLQQPYAGLVAGGVKGYETRSWKTSYRGPLAIHAGWTVNKELREARHRICTALDCKNYYKFMQHTDVGAILAVVELVDIYMISTDDANDDSIFGRRVLSSGHLDGVDGLDSIIVPSNLERQMGFWRRGMYAWKFENVQLLITPIRINGRQGLWTYDPEVA